MKNTLVKMRRETNVGVNEIRFEEVRRRKTMSRKGWGKKKRRKEVKHLLLHYLLVRVNE